jgi:UDPglucose 6-dehydrogenase
MYFNIKNYLFYKNYKINNLLKMESKNIKTKKSKTKKSKVSNNNNLVETNNNLEVEHNNLVETNNNLEVEHNNLVETNNNLEVEHNNLVKTNNNLEVEHNNLVETKNITLIGVGRLGLCLALCLDKAGYNVLGVDINPQYVKELNSKKHKSYEPNVEKYLKESQNFNVSLFLNEGLEFSNTIMVLVDTPLGGGDNYYDHSKVSNVLSKINKQNVENKHIIICSTIIPGYINKIGKFLLSDCINTTLSYNPEFIAQGDIINGILKPDIVLIGAVNQEANDVIQNIYTNICINEPVMVNTTPLEAELIKISINGYITTKISFANMISDACDNLRINKHRVLAAIGYDSRIGQKYFNPGYSFGGPCFPRDTHALAKVLDDININPILIHATHEYNNSHIQFQVAQIVRQVPVGPIIMQNICYKENSHVPIIEESAKLKIAQLLAMKNRQVIIKDKEYMIELVKMKYGRLFDYEIVI